MQTGRRQFIGAIVAAAANAAPAGANDTSAAFRVKTTLRIAHLRDPQFGFITGNPAMGRPAANFNENYSANLERFRSVFGCDYKSLDVNGRRIIVGNSQYWYKTEATDEQAKYEVWIKAELEKAKSFGGKVVLASHIPPFAFITEEKDSYDNHPRKGRRERLDAYVASGARFYLAAHQHRLVMRGHKTLTILSGETTCCNFDARPFGFRMFEVADDFSYSWKFIAV